ncbi:UNVERIFIED_CONTAM: hypothetical protein Sradi_2004600 [Sesamum radiatum]|uniref:Aminotransferase-like plant mobile domain-containing protein n=1 Tax=Sesamum radiatum TaxID=300843 RepID=A0AAW2THE2_SESRA
MAHGECFSLAIPVLASIYRGLRDMSTSTNLFESSAIFPIHYVYGWIGRYLHTHFPPRLEPIGAQMVKYAGENMARHFEPTKARDLFHCINPSRLLNIHFHHQGPSLVADDAKISNTFKDLFVTLRSSYLTLRIESTLSKLLIPGSVSSSPLITKEYADWWAKCNKTSLEKNTRVVLKLNHPPDLEKGSRDNQVMPATETDATKPFANTSKRRHNLAGLEEGVPVTPEGSIGSVNGISASDFPIVDVILNGELQPVSVETPSKRPKIVLPAIIEKPPIVEDVLEKSKKTFDAPSWPYSSTEVNDFCPQLIKTEAEQMLLKFYWERICQKIMTTPIERLSEVRPVIDALIKEMGTYMKDTSPLESHLKVFFDGASNYARTKLESSHKVTREVYEESLSLAKDDLFVVEAKEKEHAKRWRVLKPRSFK